MSGIIGVVVLMFASLELISVAIEVFGWRKEAAAVRWRRIVLHVGAWVLIIGAFFAIVHLGPLRPVHEWIR
jgi:hypothetical protein